MHMLVLVQTSGGAEVFAGSSEAAGPMNVDSSHSELVPSASSDVGQLDTLLCSLRDRLGDTTGQGSCRVMALCECTYRSVFCSSI